MIYLLAVFAVIVPVFLVVQSVRGRVDVRCCAVPADADARLREPAEARDGTHPS